MKNCRAREGPTLEKFMKSCVPWLRAHDGAGEVHERAGAAETTADELTSTPFLVLCIAQREEVDKSGVKLSPVECKGCREGGLRFVLISHSPALLQF